MKNYNYIQKFLHDLVFSKKFINKSLFEFEKILFLKNNNFKNNLHVFITGLSRSGTTSLLNFVHSSDQFASLKYKNMPFIFSPSISKLFYKKNVNKKKRLHGDGIIYDLNSPEAFDEVFFNTDNKFIQNELTNFIQLICTSQNKEKYLSKNNLNYKRIDLIQSILPNSIFLITIREPLHHTYSLFNQHKRFCRLQKEDDFIRRYMNYLGHYEFGLDHKPWLEPINHHNTDKINYWLEQWCLFYQNILNNYKSKKKCFFVIYEKLTDKDYVKKILNKIDVNKTENINLNHFQNSNKKKLDLDCNKDLVLKSNMLYEKFKSLS